MGIEEGEDIEDIEGTHKRNKMKKKHAPDRGRGTLRDLIQGQCHHALSQTTTKKKKRIIWRTITNKTSNTQKWRNRPLWMTAMNKMKTFRMTNSTKCHCQSKHTKSMFFFTSMNCFNLNCNLIYMRLILIYNSQTE